jgi:hypothetical protein
MLIAQRSHPKIIQERLGHAGITTRMNLYGYPFGGADITLIEGLDAAHAAAAQRNTTSRPQASSNGPTGGSGLRP